MNRFFSSLHYIVAVIMQIQPLRDGKDNLNLIIILIFGLFIISVVLFQQTK